VLLPSWRDPRLHLAAVIVSLQVLGQVAFEFRLSIAQILVALLTCAVLEIGIAFRRQRVILWPASALLTGNGVAFILRVPGTEHGDWWSMHGWWIFAGTAAVALLSKYLITFRGRHVFNPSNFGLVLCFLLLGPERADPLEFWWGPMSAWMALALAIIVVGGFAILLRLHLLHIAVGFWVAFAAGLAVLAASGHEMTARWHLGPISGWEFWHTLVFSPEVLVFLFFMITDPRTIPETARGRRAYAVGIGLLAVLLIAPQTTEFATKVAVLGALTIVCAVRPLALLARSRARSLDGLFAPVAARGGEARRVALGAVGVMCAVVFAGLVLLAGIPARPSAAATTPSQSMAGDLPEVTVLQSEEIASRLDEETARRIASDLVEDLRIEAEALVERDLDRATSAATGERLAGLWERIRASGGSVVIPDYELDRLTVSLERSDDQAPPVAVAAVEGTVVHASYAGSPAVLQSREDPAPFEQTLELVLQDGRYLIEGERGEAPAEPAVPSRVASGQRPGSSLSGIRLTNVAQKVGLDFRHGAFRFQMSNDTVAMMGGGLCWIDYDDDGWLDLYAVNSHSIEVDVARWKKQGGLPRSALYRNVGGRFVGVSRRSGADVALRGNGCVAADFDLDGRTDLYVTAAGYDALLWNQGNGRFVEGARAAGIDEYGWHTAATVGDVNGDGLPDLFVAGYADLNAPIASRAGAPFPTSYTGVRDRLYLNLGPAPRGHVRFREVGREAGIERKRVEHGLGAVFTDYDDDGRADLYVANDLDPNRLYRNVPLPGGAKADPAGLGFRLVERGAQEGVADRNAGMGVASGDFDADGRQDLFVTNSHRQLHGVFASRAAGRFEDARPRFAGAFDTTLAGWGASWADLDLDGSLDLVVANGAIPVTDLTRDAEPVQVFESGRRGRFDDASGSVGVGAGPYVNGRGLAIADYDNDGDLDAAINSIGGPLVLLRNDGARAHWLEVKLPRFSPGARVTAVLPSGKRLVREVQSGSSYLSSEDARMHFGLGRARTVRELVVRYSGGRTTRLRDVRADRVVVVKR
jgi:Na+-translocating ferredoxin:NAD+ oxidoreductase RnfD subunit